MNYTPKEASIYNNFHLKHGKSEPEYRFEFRIIKDDETFVSGSTFILPESISDAGECESVDLEVGSALRFFKKNWRKEQIADEEELPEEVDWDDSRDFEANEWRAESALFRDA